MTEATVENDGDDDEDIVDDGKDDDGEDDDALQDEQGDLQVGLPLLAHWYVLLCKRKELGQSGGELRDLKLPNYFQECCNWWWRIWW